MYWRKLRENFLERTPFLLDKLSKLGGDPPAQTDFDTFLKVLKLPKIRAGGGGGVTWAKAVFSWKSSHSHS